MPWNPTPASAALRNRRVRRRQLDRPVRRMPLELRRRRRRTPPRRTRPASPAASPRSRERQRDFQDRSRPPPSRRPGRARPSAARDGWPRAIPERPGQPPELLADREAHARRRAGTSARARARRPAGRPAVGRVDPDEQALAVEAELDQRHAAPGWPLGLVHRAGDVADLQRCRRRATRSSSSPRRRASA